MSDKPQLPAPAAGAGEDPRAELKEAFELFNQVSGELAAEYQALEQRVAQLTEELAQAHAQREQELAEKERVAHRLFSLLQLLPGGVVVLDNRGQVQACNPAAEDLLGAPLLHQPWIEVIQRAFAPRNDDGHELSLRDGRRVSMATRALQGEPGQIILLTDQTETRRLQASLSRNERLSAMGRMLASLAHQIRTPLSAALLYSSHLMRDSLADEQRIRFAGKVKSRLQNLEAQVKDMLVFARGETQLNDVLSVDQVLRELEDNLDVPLVNLDADCEFINEAGERWLQCHRETLLGALMNLVENALQAVGRGAELVVRARCEGERLGLWVEDQGPGMSDALRQQVLEPFFTTRSQGTGLGLAVAQVVARAHLGEFVLESAPGAGTRAGLLLPLLPVAGE